MKILQINTCGNLSTGSIASSLVSEAEKVGHEGMVAYARGASPNNVNSIKIGNKWDVYFHVIGTRITDKHGLYSKKATKILISKIKEYSPDIVHLHNIHGYYINIKELFNYLKVAKMKVVWTLHDCWSFTGHCAHFSYVNCTKWKSECENCPQKKGYPASILMDNSKNNYYVKREIFNSIENLTLVVPSNWLANLLKSSFLSANHIEIIPNGIDTESFRYRSSEIRNCYNLKNHIIVLGVASKWTERKGLKTFFELAKMLPNNYKIFLVGIENRDKFRIPNNIITVGKTNSVIELAEMYSTADVFVNPTLEDNYPTVNIEALACGTPVITYKTGGCSEIINDKCGIVIEHNNIKELYKVLINLHEYNFKQEDCVKSIINNSQKVFTDKYLKLYNSI